MLQGLAGATHDNREGLSSYGSESCRQPCECGIWMTCVKLNVDLTLWHLILASVPGFGANFATT